MTGLWVWPIGSLMLVHMSLSLCNELTGLHKPVVEHNVDSRYGIFVGALDLFLSAGIGTLQDHFAFLSGLVLFKKIKLNLTFC